MRTRRIKAACVDSSKDYQTFLDRLAVPCCVVVPPPTTLPPPPPTTPPPTTPPPTTPPPPPPEARYGAPMAYDASNGKLILFGGWGRSGDLNDTWCWSNNQWNQLHPADPKPIARYYASMAYNASSGQLILFGGGSILRSYFLNDTWSWSNNRWNPLSPNPKPSARSVASMAYDASSGQLILFGGSTISGSLNDTWTWDSSQNKWIQLQ